MRIMGRQADPRGVAQSAQLVRMPNFNVSDVDVVVVVVVDVDDDDDDEDNNDNDDASLKNFWDKSAAIQDC